MRGRTAARRRSERDRCTDAGGGIRAGLKLGREPFVGRVSRSATAMPITYVTRRVHFNAAHRMHNPDRSDEWNRETFGPCNHPNWHGHNYVLEITVAGEPDADTGYVLDLGELKRVVRDRVVRHLDHRNLNLDVDFLQGVLPSTENLAVAIWKRLVDALPAGRLHAVRLFESERNFVEYRGE